MRDLMNGEEQVLVRRRAKDVRDRPELPRPKRRRRQIPRPEDLHGDDAEDNPFGQRLRATKLGDLAAIVRQSIGIGGGGTDTYFGVSLDDGEAACAMRLFGIGPEEVLVAILLDCSLGGFCDCC